MDLEPGTILGKRYRLQNSIATGGMALVYHAKDLILERPVALKILRQDFSRQPAFRERFRQEARAAANLVHPNIVTVYDYGEDKENLFIVMEYIPGTDLRSIIQQDKVLSLPDAFHYMIQACAGLGYAHRAGIVHCDVKPQNMLVSKDHALKITDFGIARALATIKPEESSETVWGSPIYFSPEQAQGKSPTPASDVYSLGVIFYQLITGIPPFSANDAQELAILHSDKLPSPPSTIVENLPMEIDQVILKVLSKEPSERYRSADQFGRVLEALKGKLNLSTIYTNDGTREGSADEDADGFERINVKKQTSRISTTDWKTLLLALFALLAVGGLAPFWLYVILSIVSSK
jgi:serine/threonine protein kinase